MWKLIAKLKWQIINMLLWLVVLNSAIAMSIHHGQELKEERARVEASMAMARNAQDRFIEHFAEYHKDVYEKVFPQKPLGDSD